MKNLIIPCGGTSSRFPNMKPKWMLTYPDGELMIKKSISGLPIEKFDRIIITIVQSHIDEFDAYRILDQIFDFNGENQYELLVLKDFTKSQSDTVYQTIKQKNIKGEVVIKDSDNYVLLDNLLDGNFVTGIDLQQFSKDVMRLKSKSFLMVNEQNIVMDIIEKQISSNIICIGVYGFSSSIELISAYEKLDDNSEEVYISHLISYLIGLEREVFKYCLAKDYEDWGTLDDWRIVQSRKKTYFIDLDGVILNNVGKFGEKNWSNDFEVIEKNMHVIKELYDNGAQIVITTSRSETYKEYIFLKFKHYGIMLHEIVTDLNHAQRVLINDFAPTNPYPSATAINLPRNADLQSYISNVSMLI